jgi:hypothetical protein
MTEGIASVLEQARLFFSQHAPTEVLRQTLPLAFLCLFAGVVLSVLGAKLARFAITTSFVLLGAYAGAYVGNELAYSRPICGLVGALAIGVIGHQTFKLWVGVAGALVLSSVVLGAFGYQQILPHVVEFERIAPIAAADTPGTFALPSPEQQQGYLDRSPQQWAKELWSFVLQNNPRVERDGKSLGVFAMLTGLFFGVVATRAALILSTSLVGTGLVTTAIGTLLAHAIPNSYQAFQQRPGMAGAGVGAFLVASLVLQTMLTRKRRPGKPEPTPKS